MKFAFRCLDCHRLHAAEVAGECDTPSGCAVCGKSNFQVLAHCDAEQLAKMGLKPEDVEAHIPITAEQGRKNSVNDANKNLQSLADKEKAWNADKEKLKAIYVTLHNQLKKEQEKLNNIAGQDNINQKQLEAQINLVENIKSEMKEIEAKEFTARDQKHRTKLQAGITEHEEWLKTKNTAAPKSVLAAAVESLGAKTK